MEYRRYVTNTCVIWMFVVIFTVRSLPAISACPSDAAVIHMCEDEVIRDTPKFYLELFVPKNTSITCNCSLLSTQVTQTGFVIVQDSEENCKSVLNIEEPKSNISFLCRTSGKKTTYKHVIDSKGYLLRLNAEAAPVRSDFCINFWNIGSGSFSIQCYSPRGSTTKATTMPLTSESETATSTTTHGKDDVGGKLAAEKEKQDFPVAAVGGAAGAVVLVTVVVIVIVVFVKRNRGQKTNQQSEIDYYNIDPGTRAPKNNETNKRSEEIVTDVELIRNDLYYEGTSEKSVNCPSDDYATVEDEATTIESKSNEDNVSKALKSKHGNRNDYDDVEGETSLDDNAGMYAKVNKNKKGKTDKKTGEENVTAQSDLYAVVDKTKKKNRLPAKTAPSGDVYTLVQKPDKSKEKDAENISGDIYTEVKKPKKQEKTISEDEVSGNI